MEDNELLEHERAKYERVYRDRNYRAVNQGFELLKRAPWMKSACDTFLDIGCGDGRTYFQMRPACVWNGIDFVETLNGGIPLHLFHQCNLWDTALPVELASVEGWNSGKYDVGLCADVMEHIPPTKVESVLCNIAVLCRVCYFEIANYPSGFGDLHLTLQDCAWWLKTMRAISGVAEQIEGLERPHVREYIIRWEP